MSEISRVRRMIREQKGKSMVLSPDESLNMIAFFHFGQQVLQGEEALEGVTCLDCQDYKDSHCQGRGLKGFDQVELCLKSMIGKVTGSFQAGEDKDHPEAMLMMHENVEGNSHGHAIANTERGEEIIRLACQELKLNSKEV